MPRSQNVRPQHALVTSASGAIGGALTRQLAQQQPQLLFSLVDCDVAGMQPLGQALGERAHALRADLAKPAECPDLFAAATAKFGPVDLLINCAGIMDVRRFAETPWDLADRLLQIDLISPLRLMQLAVAGMPKHGGSIVNISSMAGRIGLRGCAYYGAAKAGLAMASRIVQLELAEAGIHVLTVLPGPVRSRLESGARAQYPDTRVTRSMPVGDPEELARRILRALHTRKTRVVYPDFYRLADRFPGIADRFSAANSPLPLSTRSQIDAG